MTTAVLADPERADYFRRRAHTGTLGAPSDFAAAAVFLAGPGSAFVTGQNLWDPSIRFLTELPAKVDPVEVTGIAAMAIFAWVGFGLLNIAMGVFVALHADRRQPHQSRLRALGLRAAGDGAVGLDGGDDPVFAQPVDQLAPLHGAAVGVGHGRERGGFCLVFHVKSPSRTACPSRAATR